MFYYYSRAGPIGPREVKPMKFWLAFLWAHTCLINGRKFLYKWFKHLKNNVFIAAYGTGENV